MSSLKVIKVLLLVMLFLMATVFLKANAFAESIIYLPSNNVGIDPCKLKGCEIDGLKTSSEDRKADPNNNSFDELAKYDPRALRFLISQDATMDDLKGELASLRDYLVNIDKSLIDNDRTIMKAQDIILKARATGNEKAGKIAEEASRKAEETKEKLLKQKGLVNSIMQKIQAMLAEADRGNYRNLSELCKGRRERLQRNENVFKRYVKDIERTSREREERIKEISEEFQAFLMDMTDATLTLIAQSKSLGISEEIKKRLERYADAIGLMSDIRKGEDIHYKSQDLKRYERQLEYVITDQEELAKELQNIKRRLEREEAELGATSSIDIFLALAKDSPLIKMLNTAKAVSTLVQYSFEIYLLNEEVKRDCEVTEEQARALNALVEEHKRSLEKVKECENMIGDK